ncbi:hypothetical protein [Roseobacter sp. HKCCA0434]|uniref:hypothetical protein n=1 Tax=Roseobacter sp. HKCCA0434 TaxID=3079297 RepID=UPI002905A1FE|nr:hypothetical protein [Roseobacter sp. HKCCA0434]
MVRLLMMVMLWAGIAQAQAQDDPIERWLAGEELPALREIAAQAELGDSWARLFLGVVEHMSELHGEDTLALDREERIALWRQPIGVSGTSWLGASDDPLVPLLLDLDTVDTQPDTVMRFWDMGEIRLAREALRAQAKREKFDLVARSVELVPDLLPSIAGRAPMAPPVPELDLMDDPDAAILRARCGSDCAPACLDALYEAIGGHAGLMQLGTPLAALIPEAQWRSSVRARMSVDGLIRQRDADLPDCAA